MSSLGGVIELLSLRCGFYDVFSDKIILSNDCCLGIFKLLSQSPCFK